MIGFVEFWAKKKFVDIFRSSGVCVVLIILGVLLQGSSRGRDGAWLIEI